MLSLKLAQTAVEESVALGIIESIPRTATGRRRFYDPETTYSQRTCMTCGQRVWRKSTSCRECYQKQRRANMLIELTCAHCGEKFNKLRAEYEKQLIRGHRFFYCTHAHSVAHYSEKYHHQCSRCHRPALTARKFCSPECRQTTAREAKRRINCGQCGESFIPRTNRSTYCSQLCKNLGHSIRMRGLGNSHFKTGTSYAKLFRKMRLLIFERDGNRCVTCSGTSHLVGHHIDENPINNIPINLITLCRSCHIVHHKSKVTPWPWFAIYAQVESLCMISKWKERTTSLLMAYSSTTACSSTI